MNKQNDIFNIVMAEDDSDDFMLIKKALNKSELPHDLTLVEDGEELLDYLLGHSKLSDIGYRDLPSLILLDLNLPKKDGRQALVEIKSTPSLRRIPVVVLTTSSAKEDVEYCYQQGANSFITKPTNFQELVNKMSVLAKYWLNTVNLPYPNPAN